MSLANDRRLLKIWDVNDFVVKNAPSTIYYIKEFITNEAERKILEEIQLSSELKWTNVDGRSKQDWNYQVDKNGNLLDAELPNWVTYTYNRFMSVQNLFPLDHKTNFMRVNKYLPGQGIPPHVDSRASSDVNALITLSSRALLDFYHPQEKNECLQEKSYIGSMYLEPRSLLILSGYAYTNLLHGIKEVEKDFITEKVFNRPENLQIGSLISRQIRYSLTPGWYSKYDNDQM